MAKKIPVKIKEIQNWVNQREPGTRSISFSQLSTYLNCPKCWQRAYLLNEAPFVPNIHLIFGTAIHEVLQEWLDVLYNKTVREALEMDLDELLLGKMRALYQEERTKLGEDFSSAQELAEFYQDGVEILKYVRQHRKSFFDIKREWLVGCEIPIYYKLKDNYGFVGYIDVLTYDEESETWKIWDFKTSTGGWSMTTKKNFWKTSQVLLYKLYLSKIFNIDLDKIDVEYFIVKRKIPEDADFPAMRKRVQEFVPANGKPSLNRIEQAVDSFVQKTVDDNGQYYVKDYETTPGVDSCKYCLFRETCTDVYKI